MAFRRLFKRNRPGGIREEGREGGVALFMVLSSLTILALLVTEFTYVAQVNSRMAFDSIDQVKAHYLAKSGFKLSLIRIRAYQNLKALASSGAGGMIPKGLLEKIWSFPFFYPIPTSVPGLTPSEKEQINAFTKSAAIEGKFSALIESESSKYNLNSLLAPFAAQPDPSPTPTSTSQTGTPPGSRPPPVPTPTPTFNSDDAQSAFAATVTQILNNKIESDEDFASEYRDFKIDEFVDNVISWVDPTHQRRSATSSTFRPKGGPFYSLSELRMIEPIDDELFETLSPHFTVSATPGINVNTVKKSTLRAIFPQMTDEEADEFFKFRDSPDQDNNFKAPDDFFNYIRGNVAAFRGSDQEMEKLKAELKKKNIRVVTDETHFKITIQASVNQATRLLEAQVMVVPPKKSQSPQQTPPGTPPATPTGSGLRVTFMRIL